MNFGFAWLPYDEIVARKLCQIFAEPKRNISFSRIRFLISRFPFLALREILQALRGALPF